MFWVSEITQLSDLGMFTPALFTNAGGRDMFCPVSCKRNGRLVLETLSEADMRSFQAHC